MASALTKPVITELETNRMRYPSRRYPAAICNNPATTVAANRYSSPCCLTKVTINTAVAAVAAEIIPGLPPVIATITAMEKEAYNPTFGSTPAMIENAIASGISASATTSPDRMSARIFPNHSCCKWLIQSIFKIISAMFTVPTDARLKRYTSVFAILRLGYMKRMMF